MARRLMAPTSLLAMLALVALAAGCGVKTPPQSSSYLAPPPAQNLTAEPRADGMLVSFEVPSAPTPQRAVQEVRLYYGYLPLTGDPDCPPCPPRLRKYHEFNLTQMGESPTVRMDGGRFKYLDRNASLNKEAVYQVVLIDAAGRQSLPSGLLRQPRLLGAAAPTGLTAKAGDKVVSLSWQKVTTLTNGQPARDLAGYLVSRKGPDGEKKLNLRPVKEPEFVDQTVANGQSYSYQVFAARKFRDLNLPGAGSAWVSAKPGDLQPPKPPQDLAGASAKEGIYLRFTPSPDMDVAGYYIFRQNKGGAWEKITEALVTENVYVDRTVQTEVQYYYKVQAVDEAGNASEFSEVMDIVHLP